MKRCWIIIVLVLFGFFPMPVKAEKMLVNVMNDFSSHNPPKEYSIILPEAIQLKEGQIIEKGSIIKGEILRVMEPKRLKQDAYFIFVANSFTVPSDDSKLITIENKMESKIKSYKKKVKLDKKEMAKTAGLTVAGALVKGLDLGISFAEGATKPQKDESRFHSGCRHIVESWPFNYCLKGNEIDIKSDTAALLYFDKKMFKQ